MLISPKQLSRAQYSFLLAPHGLCIRWIGKCINLATSYRWLHHCIMFCNSFQSKVYVTLSLRLVSLCLSGPETRNVVVYDEVILPPTSSSSSSSAVIPTEPNAAYVTHTVAQPHLTTTHNVAYAVHSSTT